MKTLQEQYNLIKEGKGNKEILLKTAKQLYPNVIPNHFTYNQAVPLLKQRGLLHESIGGVVTKGTDPDWFSIFNNNLNKLNEDNDPMVNFSFKIKSIPDELNPELKKKLKIGQEVKIEKKWKNATGSNEFLYGLNVAPTYGLTTSEINQLKKENINEAKAIEKKPTKDVVDMETKGYDYKNKENIDNIYGQAFLIGYYAEMKDPANADKTVDDLKAIVAKNLYKDPLYYVKNGQFGVKGVGYTDEAPGLKASKTDQMTPVPDQVKPKTSKTDLGDREKKTGAAKKVKGEMTVTPKSSKGVKKMPLPGKEKKIKLQENIEENNIRSIISQLIKEELEEVTYQMGTNLGSFSGGNKGGGEGDGEGGNRKIPRVLFLPKSAIESINSLKPGSVRLVSRDKEVYMYVSDMFVNAMNELERGRTSYEKESKKSELARLISDKIPSAVRSKIKKETNPKKDMGLNMHYVNLILANNKDRTGYWILLKKEFDPLMREAWEGAEFDTGKFDDGPQPPDDMDMDLTPEEKLQDLYDEIGKESIDIEKDVLIAALTKQGVSPEEALIRTIDGLYDKYFFGGTDVDEGLEEGEVNIVTPSGTSADATSTQKQTAKTQPPGTTIKYKKPGEA